MTDIDALLEEARTRAVNYGELYGAKETADDHCKLTYAMLYESAPAGTVGERDSWVKRQQDYIDAVERKRDAFARWKAAETYMRLLMAEVDVYRTKEASKRWLDQVHT